MTDVNASRADAACAGRFLDVMLTTEGMYA